MKRLILLLLTVLPLVAFSQAYRPAKIITLTAGGGTENISGSNYIENHKVTGTATLTASWTIQPSGSFLAGTVVKMFYDADITLGSNTVTIFGKAVPSSMSTSPFYITSFYDGSAWTTVFSDLTSDYVSFSNDTLYVGDDAITSLIDNNFFTRSNSSITPEESTDTLRARYVAVSNTIAVEGRDTITGAANITLTAYNNIVLNGDTPVDSIKIASAIPDNGLVYIEIINAGATGGVNDGNNIKMASNFIGAGDGSMIVFQRRGNNFFEITRSSN